MLCGGRAHRKILEKRQKNKMLPSAHIEKYKDDFPFICEEEVISQQWMWVSFISKAHTNLTSILIEAQSQEEVVRRVKALPRHAVDDHSQCDYHPLVVCSCGACDQIVCQGKPYKTKFRLDCKFHALLYEIECHARAKQVKELIHPVLNRGHSNALEASHNVFIRFRSKDISLERLHYHVSTNLALLQATCMQSLALVTIGFLNSIAA